MTIHKAVLPNIFNEMFIINTPEGAEVLDIQLNKGEAVLWYRFESKGDLLISPIKLVGLWTGADFNFKSEDKYLKTLQLGNPYSPLVVHYWLIK